MHVCVCVYPLIVMEQRPKCRSSHAAGFHLFTLQTAEQYLQGHIIGNDVRLVGRTEAQVVKYKQRVAPVLCQVCQQFQGASHPEDTLLAVLREREIDQQPQPQAQ